MLCSGSGVGVTRRTGARSACATWIVSGIGAGSAGARAGADGCAGNAAPQERQKCDSASLTAWHSAQNLRSSAPPHSPQNLASAALA